MNANPPSAAPSPSVTSPLPTRTLTAPVLAGCLAWVAIALGFVGLRFLMQERPQFVGQPLHTSKAQLVQDTPRFVARQSTDDLSVIKPLQPASARVRFAMKGHRDYRGLRTLSDMSGEVRAEYTFTNHLDEPLFVLGKCPHPHADRTSGTTLQASGLRLESSVPGVQENAKDAWLWSGTMAPHTAVTLGVAYHVAALGGVTYRIQESSGTPIQHLRVTFQREDLDSMRFESGDGATAPTDATVEWERHDFMPPDFFSASIVESRTLYTSLGQLLEMGPLVCMLFLLAVLAVLLTRQSLTVVQVLTICAGYALYFPLILYLSARFSFAVALVVAVAVPGVLLVNYARWLLGGRLGLIGGPVFLGLYQVFPTLAAFAGWNRGMVLLSLGVVTLWVLINLQNQAFRRRAGTAALVLLGATGGGLRGEAGEAQLLLPGDWAGSWLAEKAETNQPVIAFDPVEYRIRERTNYFEVQARLTFHALRAGTKPIPLFALPVHLSASRLTPQEPGVLRLVNVTNRLGLWIVQTGHGALELDYRAPVGVREGKPRVQIPLLQGTPGNVRLESSRRDLEFVAGSLWGTEAANGVTRYDLGVAGEEALTFEWRADGDGGQRAGDGMALYGIGVTRAQNLTIINSDGSCTHFVEFELPVALTEEFRLRLPPAARLISVSMNGTEISAPPVDDQLCRLRLPSREGRPTGHRLSFRLAYPPTRLGFVGTLELVLPELALTVGTLEWVVVLPSGFETQVISGNLEVQKTVPDLASFGDYGRILKSHPHTALSKNLAPPGRASLSLKYRQAVPGL